MKITFMRHAKTTMNKSNVFSGRTDCDITQEGAEEARKSFSFRGNDFDFYYVSPLKRTRQTLDAILPNRTPIVDERIIEWDFGKWEGMPYSNLTTEETQAYVDGKNDPPEGETFMQVQKRTCEFVEDLFFKHDSHCRILVVAHSTILRMVRDNFLPNMEKKPIRNSQTIVITEKEFNEYLTRKKVTL